MLRDDLIVELARRQSADAKQISMVRGLDRGNLRRAGGELAECVKRALALDDDECPRGRRRESTPKWRDEGGAPALTQGWISRRLVPS